jgi:predicted membrane protein
MDEINEKMEQTMQKYLLLMKMIGTMEDRLLRSEMVYLIVNIFIFFTSTISLNILKPFGSSYFYIGTYFFLFWLVIGMFVCAFWIASAMRLQLKLKLHYFQARFLERKMDSAGENFCSDEDIFFDPKIRKIESPDKKEFLQYPVKGFARMDGFVGASKPRHLTWILPSIFFILYLLGFVYIVLFDIIGLLRS